MDRLFPWRRRKRKREVRTSTDFFFIGIGLEVLTKYSFFYNS